MKKLLIFMFYPIKSTENYDIFYWRYFLYSKGYYSLLFLIYASMLLLIIDGYFIFLTFFLYILLCVTFFVTNFKYNFEEHFMKKINNITNTDNLQSKTIINESNDLRESMMNTYNPNEDINKSVDNLNESDDILNKPKYKADEYLTEQRNF